MAKQAGNQEPRPGGGLSTSYRLDETTLGRIDRLAAEMGVSKSAVVVLAVRDLARRELGEGLLTGASHADANLDTSRDTSAPMLPESGVAAGTKSAETSADASERRRPPRGRKNIGLFTGSPSQARGAP